jgi:hypothetical protein
MNNWLSGVVLGNKQSAGFGITIFPVTLNRTVGRDYLTLSEAKEKGLLTLPESGTVPEIKISIMGDQPVLVPEGDVIIGGWQNRSVNISILLEPRKVHCVPVSCVEKGRWRTASYRSDNRASPKTDFDVAAYKAHAQLRRVKTTSTVSRMKTQGEALSDQMAVWREIDRKLFAVQSVSPTQDMTAIFQEHAQPIDQIVDSLDSVAGQVGAIVAIGSEIVGMDIFDHPDTWRVSMRRTLRSYAADAIERGDNRTTSASMEVRTAAKFLTDVMNALARAEVRRAPVGIGHHHLLGDSESGVEGFALVANGAARHIFAFPKLAGVSER